MSMYARGMTTREISEHLEEIYGVEVGRDTISRVTDAVLDDVKEWQSRPLEKLYLVVWLDAIVLKIRDQGSVRTSTPTSRSASASTGSRRSSGSGWSPPRARSSGCA